MIHCRTYTTNQKRSRELAKLWKKARLVYCGCRRCPSFIELGNRIFDEGLKVVNDEIDNFNSGGMYYI